jgi:hypothetical protein
MESTKFTTEECLKFERIKNEKLQYFLVNSVKMTNELEVQLMNARRELKVARDELNAHITEVASSSTKYRQEKFEKESETSEDSEEEDIDQSSNKKRKQIQQERRKGNKSSASKTLKSYDTIRPINSRVEVAIESVKTALSNPHINTPARDFLFKFVCRIFDGGDVFYGYLVSYNRLHFQVSYEIKETKTF